MPATPRPQTTPSIPDSVQTSRSGGNLIKTLRILVAAGIGMAALLSLLPAAGHDQIWFLLMGERWIGGATLYGPTLFDSNPPLVVWLSAIPVLLGEYFGLSPTALGKLLVLLVEFIGASLSLSILRRLSPGLGRTLTSSQITWLAFAFVCIFAVAPARDLGQRDHLTAILCLPYVLAAAVDDREAASPSHALSSRRKTFLLRTLTGLLAAVGICLKPHQVLIPIAVELTRLLTSTRAAPVHPTLRTRLGSLLRPEPPVLILSGVAFLLLIHRFAPAYFTLALPTLRDTYWAIGHLTPLQLLAEAPQLHLLAALSLALFVRAPRSPEPDPFRRATTLLIAAGLAASAAYYLQGTGWYYQQLPAISLFAAALALQLLNLPTFARLPDSPWIPRATAALAILALALTAHFTGYPFTLDRSFAITSPDPAFFEHLQPGTPVAIITTSVDDSMMPVARYHLLWAQRTNNVWTLPAILRSEDPQGHPPRHTLSPERLAQLERQQHAWMLEDLARWQPKLILVARCQAPEVHCQELEDRHDDLLAWFAQDPAFQQIWGSYRYLRTSGSYDSYTRTN